VLWILFDTGLVLEELMACRTAEPGDDQDRLHVGGEKFFHDRVAASSSHQGSGRIQSSCRGLTMMPRPKTLLAKLHGSTPAENPGQKLTMLEQSQ